MYTVRVAAEVSRPDAQKRVDIPLMGDNGEMQWRRSGHSPIMNGPRGRHNDFDFLYDMRGLQALSLTNRLS
jgi:hypothetical protein